MASMSLGSIFTTVFMNARRSAYFLTPTRRIAGHAQVNARVPRAASRTASVSFQNPAARKTAGTLKPPPRPRDAQAGLRERKILCRGQAPNEGEYGRQDSLQYYVLSFLVLD